MKFELFFVHAVLFHQRKLCANVAYLDWLIEMMDSDCIKFENDVKSFSKFSAILASSFKLSIIQKIAFDNQYLLGHILRLKFNRPKIQGTPTTFVINETICDHFITYFSLVILIIKLISIQ